MSDVTTFPLRLPASLRQAVEKLSKEDGASVNEFIALAVAEKVSALATEAEFAERARRADLEAAMAILSRPGGAPPEPEDRLPPSSQD